MRDALILPTDPGKQLHAVDDLVESRRRHEEREDVGWLVDIRGADACLEDRDGLLVFRLESLEPPGLPREQGRQLVEASLRAGQLALQSRNARLRRVDRRLRILELGDDRRELRRQDSLLRLRLGDLRLQRGDPGIHRGLVALGSLGSGRRRHRECDREREDSEQPPSHRSSFAHPPVDPSQAACPEPARRRRRLAAAARSERCSRRPRPSPCGARTRAP